MRCIHVSLILVAVCAGALTACGGGGSSTATPGTSVTTTATSTTTTTITSTNNVQPIIVDSGPAGLSTPAINEAFTSVTICAPNNPSLCQAIDHVLVDTGSSGLRIGSWALNSTMASALSAQSTAGNNTLVECTMFVDGYAWGPVRSVNFQIAGETVQGLPMQVIGDPNFSSVPAACSSTGPAENSLNGFGSNGVIGVGLFQQDCGSGCLTANPTQNLGYYYTCSSSSCTETTAGLTQQLPNPVSLFANDNNGVIVALPSIAGGAPSASGTLTFGVGTQSNNALGGATVIPMDPAYGQFTTIFDGTPMTESYIDSGSNGLFFPNLGNIAVCPNFDVFAGWFCPPSQINLSATMETKGAGVTVNFSIGNINSAYAANPAYAVYVPLGAPLIPAQNFDRSYTFAWGLPFFFGRNVMVVTENKAVGGNTGPFVAF